MNAEMCRRLSWTLRVILSIQPLESCAQFVGRVCLSASVFDGMLGGCFCGWLFRVAWVNTYIRRKKMRTKLKIAISPSRDTARSHMLASVCSKFECVMTHVCVCVYACVFVSALVMSEVVSTVSKTCAGVLTFNPPTRAHHAQATNGLRVVVAPNNQAKWRCTLHRWSPTTHTYHHVHTICLTLVATLGKTANGCTCTWSHVVKRNQDLPQQFRDGTFMVNQQFNTGM